MCFHYKFKTTSSSVLSGKKKVLEWIVPHANKDDLLLSVPERINIIDGFQYKKILREQDKSFPTILNLIRFLKSINQSLVIVYACHRLIRSSIEHLWSLGDDEINDVFDKSDLILGEYSFSVKIFITNLKIAIDQLILMIVSNSEKINSIGKFLYPFKKSNTLEENFDRLEKIYGEESIKFLVGLNIVSNYLKHDPLLFSSMDQILGINDPGIVALVPKKLNDFAGFRRYFNGDLNQNDAFFLPIRFLVNGFNYFLEYLKKE